MADNAKKPGPVIISDDRKAIKGSQSGGKTSENVKKAIEAVKKSQENDK